MKGISTILAMILIVIIVVALIGLTYTFAVSLFSTTTSGATEQTTAVTTRLQKSVAIVARDCQISGATTTFYFTLKNTGTLDITSTELRAFVDGTQITSGAITFNDIPKGEVDTEINFDNETASQGTAGTHTLRISAPAGEVDTTVTCS
jgi:archaellum component FlaG (FlaF/FlaG flagellin family)